MDIDMCGYASIMERVSEAVDNRCGRLKECVPFWQKHSIPMESDPAGYAMAREYQRQGTARQDSGVVEDALDVYVQKGARRMLAADLEGEVSALLGRHRYEQAETFRGHGNGYDHTLHVTPGVGPVDVEAPHVPWSAPPLTNLGVAAKTLGTSDSKVMRLA